MATSGSDRPRVRTALRLGAAVAIGGLLVGTAAYAADLGSDQQRPTGDTLARAWSARTGGQQVLGGHRTPGVPSVQRLRHDDVTFTVTVAPARPGPNLVRVDSTHEHTRGRAGTPPVLVGTD